MKTLGDLFNRQHEYMELACDSYGVYAPITSTAPVVAEAKFQAKTQEAKEVILALEDELHEVLGELNWKPWKKNKKPVDQSKLLAEIADCWHFLLELTMLFNFEADLLPAMERSFKKNHDRLKAGY